MKEDADLSSRYIDTIELASPEDGDLTDNKDCHITGRTAQYINHFSRKYNTAYSNFYSI